MLKNSCLSIMFYSILSFCGLSQAADYPAPVLQTGQTTSYATGDDGELKKGVSTTPRFQDNGDGTVTDKLTTLIWMKNANCWGEMSWSSALTKIAELNAGSATCADYTGSHNDWHLPNIRELRSLIDYGQYSPALPVGYVFTGVQSSYYWSGSSYAGNPSDAWFVVLNVGHVSGNDKSNSYYVWSVRGR